jgi:impB/mucB/samB family C-terminal domain
VTVKLKDADFRLRAASRTLEAPVVADRVILLVARELLYKLRRTRRTPARLLGVGLSGLADGDEQEQLSLFGEGAPMADLPAAVHETPRDRALAGAVDTLRARFGADAIVPGRLAGGAPNGSRAAGAPPPAPGKGARRSGR